MSEKTETNVSALVEALEQIAGETYDAWTNGAQAGRIATAALTSYRETVQDDAELNELRAERDVLQAELAAMREQKPVAWEVSGGDVRSKVYEQYPGWAEESQFTIRALVYSANDEKSPSPTSAEVVPVPRALAQLLYRNLNGGRDQLNGAEFQIAHAEIRALLATSQGEAK